MSATTPTATEGTGVTIAAGPLDGIRLHFGGILRSEWIKLRSLRSTVWCLALVIVLSIGIAALASGLIPLDHPGAMPASVADRYLVEVSTAGIAFTQLAAAVLGVLVISGEYTTGMIRSTFTADPRRFGAFFGKLIMLAVVIFVVGVVSIGISALVGMWIFNARGLSASLGHSEVLLPMLGGAGYLALIALLAYACGAILRSSAGGISTIMGVLLVLPVALSLIGALTQAQWVTNVAAFLPTQAGGHIYAYVDPNAPAVHAPAGLVTLDAGQGALVLAAWVVVGLVVAAVLTKRRDV